MTKKTLKLVHKRQILASKKRMLSALPEYVVDGIVMERKRSLSVVLGLMEI